MTGRRRVAKPAVDGPVHGGDVYPVGCRTFAITRARGRAAIFVAVDRVVRRDFHVDATRSPSDGISRPNPFQLASHARKTQMEGPPMRLPASRVGHPSSAMTAPRLTKGTGSSRHSQSTYVTLPGHRTVMVFSRCRLLLDCRHSPRTSFRELDMYLVLRRHARRVSASPRARLDFALVCGRSRASQTGADN
jgi:hypothetical protein